mgnify:CR=1 FL=1
MPACAIIARVADFEIGVVLAQRQDGRLQQVDRVGVVHRQVVAIARLRRVDVPLVGREAVLDDAACTFFDLDFEIAGGALHRFHVRIGDQLDVHVPADLDQTLDQAGLRARAETLAARLGYSLQSLIEVIRPAS